MESEVCFDWYYNSNLNKYSGCRSATLLLLWFLLTRLVLEVVDGDPGFASACLSPIARARGRALAVGDGRRGQVVEAEAAAELGQTRKPIISSDQPDCGLPDT